MAAKIPRAYRKPIPAKRFERTILRRIHIEKEREFFEQAFRSSDDGTRQVREDLSQEEIKRLARVARDVKKNRGMLRMGRIAIPLVIVAAAVVFNLLFLDRILESAGEGLLEDVFGARVEIEALDVRPFSGELTLGALVVADRDRPMRNLFQFGRTTAAIRLPELLTGRVVIRELSARGLAFATGRTTSGLLEGQAAPEGGAAAEAADRDGAGGGVADRAASGVEAVAGSLGLGGVSFDVEELIADAADDLTVTTLVPEAIEDARATIDRTEQQLAALRTRTEELGETVSDLRDVDAATFQDPQRILATVATVEAARDSVGQLEREARTLRGTVEDEIERARATEQRLRDAAEADFEAIRARIPDLDVDPGTIAEDALRAFAAGFLGESWNTVNRLVATARRLREAFPEDEDPRERARRGGVDVPFAETPYPRFMIEQLAADGRGDGQDIALAISDISSDPDLTDSVTTVRFSRSAAGEELAVDLALDLRREAATPASAEIARTGAAPSLPAAAREIGLESLAGSMAVGGRATLSAEEILEGTLSATIADPELTAAVDASALTALVARVASEEEAIDAELGFTVEEAGVTSLEGSTSLTAAIRRQVDAAIAEVRAEAEARVRAELDRVVAEQLARLTDEIDALDSLAGLSTEELTRLETYQQLLAEQQAELESRVADIRGQAEAAARAAAEEAAAQARAEAEAAAEEAAEAAREEAGSRVRDAAGNLGLPGLGNRNR